VQVCTSNNYVHIKPHQLSSEIRQPFHSAVPVPLNEDDVAAIHISEITQAFLERMK
jgi:hypothetical protein